MPLLSIRDLRKRTRLTGSNFGSSRTTIGFPPVNRFYPPMDLLSASEKGIALAGIGAEGIRTVEECE